MAETFYELTYNETQRAVTQQAQDLDELRSRTGTLLAVAVLSSSFLGEAVLSDKQASTGLELTGAFFLSVFALLAIALLFPATPAGRATGYRGWMFNMTKSDI